MTHFILLLCKMDAMLNTVCQLIPLCTCTNIITQKSFTFAIAKYRMALQCVKSTHRSTLHVHVCWLMLKH